MVKIVVVMVIKFVMGKLFYGDFFLRYGFVRFLVVFGRMWMKLVVKIIFVVNVFMNMKKLFFDLRLKIGKQIFNIFVIKMEKNVLILYLRIDVFFVVEFFLLELLYLFFLLVVEIRSGRIDKEKMKVEIMVFWI